MENRLTFGFRNTELLVGIFFFFSIVAFMLGILSTTSQVLNFIIFWQLSWGISFGLLFKKDDILKEKGYFGALLWAVHLISPITFLVKSFNFNKIINFINKL